MDHKRFELYQRARPDCGKAQRCKRTEDNEGGSKLIYQPQASSKTSAQGKLEEKGGTAGRRGTITSPPPTTSRAREALAPADEPHDATSTVPRVMAALPRWILATRTPFSKPLAQTFHLHPGEPSPDSVVFPLFLADYGIFASSGPQLSKRKWLCLLRKRMSHVLIVALNFIYGGGFSVDVELLRRRPDSVQIAAHARFWALLTTCDTPGLCFPPVPGRSSLEFIARLKEMEDFATQPNLLLIDPYEGGPVDYEDYQIGHIEPQPDSSPVQPYSLLNEDRGENLQLVLPWSTQKLLTLVAEPPYRKPFSKVFNAYKNKEVDRRIGDSRLPNSVEHTLQGSSQFLLGGYLMCNVGVPPGYRATGSITDRKVFYCQASATLVRAQMNVLPFAYDLEIFRGTPAYEDFLQRRASRPSRETGGDGFGKTKRPAPFNPSQRVYPDFRSLLQGVHLGVELALSAHGSLLEDAGLRAPECRILGKKPLPNGRLYGGLLLDDYFVVSVDKLSTAVEVSPRVETIDRAFHAYKKDGVLGSQEKGGRGPSHLKVFGAEVNSSEAARSKSMTMVAAPAEKRGALVVLSMRVASRSIISSSLAARLAGNWSSILMYRMCLTCLLSKIYSLETSKGKEDVSRVFRLSRSAAQKLLLAAILSWVATTDVSADYLKEVFATDASMHRGAVTARAVLPEVAEVLRLGGDKKGGYTTLLKHLALRGGGCRFSVFLDSRAAKGSFSKGRSSAYALSPALRRAAAIQVTFGLYPALGSVLMGLNVADDPTRDHCLREPATHSVLLLFARDAAEDLHALGLPCRCANWLRLCILVWHLGPGHAACYETPFSAGGSHWTFGFAGLWWTFGLLLPSLPFSWWFGGAWTYVACFVSS